MEFSVVTRRRALKEEGNFYREGGRSDRRQGRPQQRFPIPRRKIRVL